MMKLQCYNTKLLCLFFFMAIFIPLTVSARCGAVNYSLGAQQLHNAAVFVGTDMVCRRIAKCRSCYPFHNFSFANCNKDELSRRRYNKECGHVDRFTAFSNWCGNCDASIFWLREFEFWNLIN